MVSKKELDILESIFDEDVFKDLTEMTNDGFVVRVTRREKDGDSIESLYVKINETGGDSKGFIIKRGSKSVLEKEIVFYKDLLPNILESELKASLPKFVHSKICDETIFIALEDWESDGFLPLPDGKFENSDEFLSFVENLLAPLQVALGKFEAKEKLRTSQQNLEKNYEAVISGAKNLVMFGRMSNSLYHNNVCKFIDKVILNPDKTNSLKESFLSQDQPLPKSEKSLETVCHGTFGQSDIWMNPKTRKYLLTKWNQCLIRPPGYDIMSLILQTHPIESDISSMLDDSIKIITRVHQSLGSELTSVDFRQGFVNGRFFWLMKTISEVANVQFSNREGRDKMIDYISKAGFFMKIVQCEN